MHFEPWETFMLSLIINTIDRSILGTNKLPLDACVAHFSLSQLIGRLSYNLASWSVSGVTPLHQDY